MNVLSLFDGMSCGMIALERVGIKVNTYYASEIKEHAIKVSKQNYPNIVQLGDIQDIKSNDLPKIDLVIGGSNCQDFSRANKEKLGLEGSKSKLFFEYLRLLKECKPKYFLLENVKMKKEWQDIISEHLGVQPININSSLVCGALRNRLYWTNIPSVTQPLDKGIKLQDILKYGYSPRNKARCLLESDSRPLSTPVKMVHRDLNKGFTTLIYKSKKHYEQIKKHFDKHFKKKSAEEIEKYDGDLSFYNGVRYLTAVERERLQTVPEGYCHNLSDNDAACLLGDGWTVDVIAHIFKGLKMKVKKINYNRIGDCYQKFCIKDRKYNRSDTYSGTGNVMVGSSYCSIDDCPYFFYKNESKQFVICGGKSNYTRNDYYNDHVKKHGIKEIIKEIIND